MDAKPTFEELTTARADAGSSKEQVWYGERPFFPSARSAGTILMKYNQRQESICEKPFFVLLDCVFCCSDVRSNR
jgi:hypothetical protein